MPEQLRTILVALALALVIALLSGGDWTHFVMGAVYALSLWVMLFFIGAAKDGAIVRSVHWTTFAMAAAITVVLGYVFYRVGDDNGALWAPAVILAGTLMWPRRSASETDASR